LVELQICVFTMLQILGYCNITACVAVTLYQFYGCMFPLSKYKTECRFCNYTK